ncbi:MAG: sulfotransferase [Calditrichaeota bacterium]|nr:MAG: sulfotransferase [Calditrichota bacterium]
MDSVIGLLPGQWFKLLKENKFKIAPFAWPHCGVIKLLSVRNYFFHKQERVLEKETESIKVNPPVFIIGHWRSGTTFLHNLLSRDPRFIFPQTYQVRNPNTFLFINRRFNQNLQQSASYKRAMDNVQSSSLAPAEDEFALAAMTLHSPLIGWLFPQRQTWYDRYTQAEALDNDWQNAYMRFFRKIQHAQPEKTILSKSPLNTPRVDLLLKIFPKARFIHIHRDPQSVFRSTVHLYHTAIRRSALQHIPYSIPDRVIERYQTLYGPFLGQRSKLTDHQLAEISFKELETDPMEALQKIYAQLNLESFDMARPHFETYLAGLKHKKNEYPPLDENSRSLIRKHWEPIYREWNYTV